MEWLNIIIQGALLGGIYALFAIGLSLSFGIMRLVNIAPWRPHRSLGLRGACCGQVPGSIRSPASSSSCR